MKPTPEVILSLQAELRIYDVLIRRLDRATDALWEADRMVRDANTQFDCIRELIDGRRQFIAGVIRSPEEEQA